MRQRNRHTVMDVSNDPPSRCLQNRTQNESALHDVGHVFLRHSAGCSNSSDCLPRFKENWRRWFELFRPVALLDALLPILHPAHHVYIIWSVFMLVVMASVIVCVPLQIGFHRLQQMAVFRITDWLSSIAFMLDVLVQFRAGYISSQGEVERNSRLIASRYLKGYFTLDLMSALPYQAVVNDHFHQTIWLMLLKMPRLMRLYRMLSRLGRGGRYVNLLSMGRLLVNMMLLVHVSVCMWHYLYENNRGRRWAFDTCDHCTGTLSTYLFGFYRSFLLLLGDRPVSHNDTERIFVICMLYLGTLFYAIVVGSMALLVANMWAVSSRHKQRAAMVDDALRYRGVSHEVREQVGEYFEHLASFQHPGPDGVAFLQELPVGLYGNVVASMFGPRLSQVQLFKHCERPFLWRLAQRLRLSLFMAGDTIYEVGSVGHDMYIVWSGAVALVGPTSCMTALLCDGDHFGELGLMVASTTRPHRAVALRPTDIMLLSRWDLQDAMKDFPDSAALVKERARRRIEDHEIPDGGLWAAAADIAFMGHYNIPDSYVGPTTAAALKPAVPAASDGTIIANNDDSSSAVNFQGPAAAGRLGCNEQGGDLECATGSISPCCSAGVSSELSAAVWYPDADAARAFTTAVGTPPLSLCQEQQLLGSLTRTQSQSPPPTPEVLATAADVRMLITTASGADLPARKACTASLSKEIQLGEPAGGPVAEAFERSASSLNNVRAPLGHAISTHVDTWLSRQRCHSMSPFVRRQQPSRQQFSEAGRQLSNVSVNRHKASSSSLPAASTQLPEPQGAGLTAGIANATPQKSGLPNDPANPTTLPFHPELQATVSVLSSDTNIVPLRGPENNNNANSSTPAGPCDLQRRRRSGAQDAREPNSAPATRTPTSGPSAMQPAAAAAPVVPAGGHQTTACIARFPSMPVAKTEDASTDAVLQGSTASVAHQQIDQVSPTPKQIQQQLPANSNVAERPADIALSMGSGSRTPASQRNQRAPLTHRQIALGNVAALAAEASPAMLATASKAGSLTDAPTDTSSARTVTSYKTSGMIRNTGRKPAAEEQDSPLLQMQGSGIAKAQNSSNNFLWIDTLLAELRDAEAGGSGAAASEDPGQHRAEPDCTPALHTSRAFRGNSASRPAAGWPHFQAGLPPLFSPQSLPAPAVVPEADITRGGAWLNLSTFAPLLQTAGSNSNRPIRISGTNANTLSSSCLGSGVDLAGMPAIVRERSRTGMGPWSSTRSQHSGSVRHQQRPPPTGTDHAARKSSDTGFLMGSPFTMSRRFSVVGRRSSGDVECLKLPPLSPMPWLHRKTSLTGFSSIGGQRPSSKTGFRTAGSSGPASAHGYLPGMVEGLPGMQLSSGRLRGRNPGSASMRRPHRNGVGSDADMSDDWSEGSAEREKFMQLQRRLEQSEAALAAVFADPLQVPAIAAIVQHEVQAVSSRLAAAMDRVLACLLNRINATLVHTEDLAQQMEATDDRLQRLENAQAEQSGVGADSILGTSYMQLDTTEPTITRSLSQAHVQTNSTGLAFTAQVAQSLLQTNASGSSSGKMLRGSMGRRSRRSSQISSWQLVSIMKNASISSGLSTSGPLGIGNGVGTGTATEAQGKGSSAALGSAGEMNDGRDFSVQVGRRTARSSSRRVAMEAAGGGGGSSNIAGVNIGGSDRYRVNGNRAKAGEGTTGAGLTAASSSTVVRTLSGSLQGYKSGQGSMAHARESASCHGGNAFFSHGPHGTVPSRPTISAHEMRRLAQARRLDTSETALQPRQQLK